MKLSRMICLVLFALCFFAQSGEFLPVNQAFKVKSYEPGENGSLVVSWEVSKGYYLYKSKLKALANGSELEIDTPNGTMVQDVNFGDQSVFKTDFNMIIKNPSSTEVVVRWQGCAEAGLCYPPEVTKITLPPSTQKVSQSDDEKFFEQLSEQSVAVIIGSFFVVGVLLAFTPCSLPMLPILANVVIGGDKRRALLLSGVYTVSMAAIYALAGVLTAMAGANLQVMFQSPVALFVFAFVLICFAASMFGLFELQLPQALTSKLTTKSERTRGGSVSGACALGLFSALIIGPCMTAPLAGALFFISETGEAFIGGFALFALGLGMGLPLMLISVAGRSILPKPGEWMNHIKALLGVILVFTAVYFLSKTVSLSVAVAIGAVALLLIGCFNFTRKHRLERAFPLGVGVVMMVISFVTIQNQTEQTGGSKSDYFTTVDSLDGLRKQINEAIQLGKPTFIDVYADWCVSCVTMDSEVFSSREAEVALSGYKAIKVDVTKTTGKTKRLLNKLKVLGPPTLIILNKDGVEDRARRVTGEVSLSEFVSAVREAVPAPNTPAELFKAQSQL